jgi:cysteinyl-tRNA synthetase
MTRLADFVARVEALARVESAAPVAAGGATARLDAAALDTIGRRLAEARAGFRDHIAADLNVPAALGVVFELVRDLHAAMDRGEVRAEDAAAVLETVETFDRVIGVLALRREEDARPPMPAEEIDRLIAERREARRTRQFARADEIRRELDARGIVLEDTATGTRWKRK